MAATPLPAPGPLRVVLFAGPSGGHLFPAVAFAEAFKTRHPASQLFLVTSRKAEALTSRIPSGIFDGFFYLSNFPAPSGISLRTLGFLLKLLHAFWHAFRFLKVLKPDLCLGFGSYASYPGVTVARLLRIPTLIHEQNLIPGRATRWLLKKACGVALSFSETADYFGILRSPHVIRTGLPLRKQMTETAKQKPWSRAVMESGKNLFCLLVVGGSQGAKAINKAVVDAVALFDCEERSKMAVIHITGRADFGWVSASYGRLGVQNETYPFFEKMEDLYGRADMAVTRAGGNTLFELALFRIPALIIPYPYAGEHQAANARYFASRGAVLLCKEEELTGDFLSARIRELRDGKDLRRLLADSIGRLADPGAADRLCGLAEELLGEK